MRKFRSKSFHFRFSKEFRSFSKFFSQFYARTGNEIAKKKFCFALLLCIYKILVALQAAINLNHLQRLNEAYPDHSFYSLVVRRGMNPPWRACLRSLAAEAV